MQSVGPPREPKEFARHRGAPAALPEDQAEVVMQTNVRNPTRPSHPSVPHLRF